MREIKFRAWNVAEKMMAMDVHKEYDTMAGIKYWKDGKETDIEPGMSSFYSYLPYETSRGEVTDDFIVEQFTGLKDKNGRDIYEGDIITLDVRQHGSRVAVVDFENGAFGLNGLSFDYGESENNWEGYIIIGNIHENPELNHEK